MTYSPPNNLCPQSGTAEAGTSFGIATEYRSGVRADPMAYRRIFRERWGHFLRANFHNHLHVAVFFSVDEKTARHWWNFITEPKGWAVSYARDTIPGAREALRIAA